MRIFRRRIPEFVIRKTKPSSVIGFAHPPCKSAVSTAKGQPDLNLDELLLWLKYTQPLKPSMVSRFSRAPDSSFTAKGATYMR